MSNIFIRRLDLQEMYFPVQLASQEKFNPGAYDAEYLFRADPAGHLIAFFDEEPAGCISSFSYGDEFGFLGRHIVRPEFRGLTIGKNLFMAAMKRFEGKTIGLNCKSQQTEYYEAFGFKPSHKVFTYEGLSHRDLPYSDNVISPFMVPFDKLNNFDKKHFPVDRKFFIQAWLNQPQSLLLGVLKDNEYAGYGLFRPLETGYSISPLICDDYDTAEILLSSLISCMEPGQPFYMDIPETNSNAPILAESMKMKKVNEYMRMYSDEGAEIKSGKVYSFFSYALP